MNPSSSTPIDVISILTFVAHGGNIFLMALTRDSSNFSRSSASTGTSSKLNPFRVKTSSNSILQIDVGGENDGTEDETVDSCLTTVTETDGTGLDLIAPKMFSALPKLGLVAGLFFGSFVTFLKPRPLISGFSTPLLCFRTMTALMEVVVETAQIARAKMVILVAIDQP
jgi:hypothetical protein